MQKKKPIILIDPYPRTMDLLFSKKNFEYLKKNFTLITAPKKNKNYFYNKYLSTAKYIIGQPDLPTDLITKQNFLKAIFNVESNFMDNMDYGYCFEKNIHVLATSPVFAQPVAEMALGLTLSIARSIHIAHNDFVKGKEKYGGEISQNNFVLKNKTFGLIGFGDLGRALTPLLSPFSNKMLAYDPWVPDLEIKKNNVQPCSLKQLLSSSDVIYILATITSSNQGMINEEIFKNIKDQTTFVLMSRAAIINFDDFYKFLKNRKVFAAIDVFPKEPFPKNHKLRKLKNVIFSPHRAGALESAFKEMGDLVIEDLKLINKGLPPRLCKRAIKETVRHLRSKPVDIN
ncbi:MAG: hydroxyacid dehydrogenase [Pelagibacteraceae bacterium]|jgi:phosphoglycerate dehydrogenase-like enzyme|nr:hydroxyacid dehydrogenase [Pelagibacteraceae bacterium]